MSTNSARAVVAKSVVELGIFSALMNVLLLVMPLYMLQIYDRVLPASNLDTLIYLSLIALSALLLFGIFEIVRGIYASRRRPRPRADWQMPA